MGKLWYLQKQHAVRYASLPPAENPLHNLNELAVKPIHRLLEHNSICHSGRFSFYQSIPEHFRFDYVHDILWADAKKYTTPNEFIERNVYFFSTPTSEILIQSIPAFKLHNVPALASQPQTFALCPFFATFSKIPPEKWTASELKSLISLITEQASSSSFTELAYQSKQWNQEEHQIATTQWNKAWNKLIHQYLRWALMAGMSGPDGAETMRILGRDESLRRLEVAREVILTRAKEESSEKAAHKQKGETPVKKPV
jgi:glutamyl-tRNA synthetase